MRRLLSFLVLAGCGAADTSVRVSPAAPAPAAPASAPPRPTGPTGPPRPVQIVAGESHACARRDDGAVFCFGYNTSGEVGAPGRRAVPEPRRVELAAPAVDVAISHSLSCAALATGALMCWGDGFGATPVEVPTTAPVDGVEVQFHEICVSERGRGTLRCKRVNDPRFSREGWRLAGEGQHGFTTMPACAERGFARMVAMGGQPAAAISPAYGNPVEGVAAVDAHGRATDASGRVLCGGMAHAEPDAAAAGVRALARGRGFSCAIDEAGALTCEGENQRGQLGRGTVWEARGAAVDGMIVTRFSASPFGVCGVTAAGGVSCAAPGAAARPVAVPGPGRVVDVDLDDATLYVVTDRGRVLVHRDRGAFDLAHPSFVPVSGTGARQVAASVPSATTHPLFMLRDHRVVYARLEGLIELGRVAALPRDLKAADVAVIQVVLHQCLREASGGALRCFLPTSGTTWREYAVDGVPASVQLAATARQLCSRSAAGDVHCWDPGQPARRIALPAPARSLAAADHLTCAALEPDGTVVCWGPDLVRAGTAPIDTPTPVAGFSGIVDLSVTVGGVCGRDAAGQVTCATAQIPREPPAPVALPAAR